MKSTLYTVNYLNGITETADTLAAAKAIADEGAAYTQQAINIEDASGEVVASRPWWGVPFDPETTEETENEIISFGGAGYYGAWES